MSKSYKKNRNLTEWTCFLKVLILANVPSFNLAINLYYKCVQSSQLTREGLESNPGPRNYVIKKVLLAYLTIKDTVAMETQQECNVQA